MKSKLLSLLLLIVASQSHAQIITTIAGDSTAGYCCDGSLALMAELNRPTDVAVDGIGNVFIADGLNNRIRKISTSGIITTIAGTGTGGYNGDGIAATAAEISYPTALTLDASGNIYFCDDHNYRIRIIHTTGIISTIAGNGTSGSNGDNGPAVAAEITASGGIAVDAHGYVYIGDNDSNRIRKIIPGGIITTIAGTGTAGYSGDGGLAANAEINQPTGVALDAAGNIYFAEFGNSCIRKINTLGIINTVAGTGMRGFSGDNGPANLAKFSWPNNLKVDAVGNIFVADVYNDRIRKIDNSGTITTIAGPGSGAFSGDGGLATNAGLHTPEGMCINAADDIYIADWGNSRIRYIRNTVSIPAVNEASEKLLVYPNPTSSRKFTVDLASAAHEQFSISITNITGRQVKEVSAFTNIPLEITLDEPDGIYILKARTVSEHWTRKIVVMHAP